MQVTDLTENSKYLLSVFWHPSLLIKICKQVQSTQDLSSQNTQRCDCSFSSAQSFSSKKIREVCWQGFRMLLWGALTSCHYASFPQAIQTGEAASGARLWLWAPAVSAGRVWAGELMAPAVTGTQYQASSIGTTAMKGSLFRIMRHSTGLTAQLKMTVCQRSVKG